MTVSKKVSFLRVDVDGAGTNTIHRERSTTNLDRAARRRGALGDTVGASKRGDRGDGLRGGKHVGAEVALLTQGVRATDIWTFLHCTRERCFVHAKRGASRS